METPKKGDLGGNYSKTVSRQSLGAQVARPSRSCKCALYERYIQETISSKLKTAPIIFPTKRILLLLGPLS